MVIETKQHDITKQLMSEDNQLVTWHYIKFPNENTRAQLEALAWFRLGKAGHLARINKEFIGFTDQPTAEEFLGFMDTPEFRSLPQTLWDDADDFNSAASDGAIALVGNIPFEESMLDISNKSISKWVKDLWLYMKIACRSRVWHHSDRFWFENKADMVLFSSYIGEQDIKTWQRECETSGTIDHAALLELLRKQSYPNTTYPDTAFPTPDWTYRPNPIYGGGTTALPAVYTSTVTTSTAAPYTTCSANDMNDGLSIKDQLRDQLIRKHGGEEGIKEMYSSISNQIATST